MYFFHYTTPEHYDAMLTGAWYKPGLLPIRPLISMRDVKRHKLPEKAAHPVVRGLLHPFDKGWCGHHGYADQPPMETMLRDIHSCSTRYVFLLRVTVSPDDDVYVANAGGQLRTKPKGRYSRIAFDGTIKRDFWDSMVPMKDYADAKVSYLVPTVVCFTGIPLDRVMLERVYDRQDLIKQVRAIGGFSNRPRDPEPHYAVLDEFLEPERPAPGPRLKLVVANPPIAG